MAASASNRKWDIYNAEIGSHFEDQSCVRYTKFGDNPLSRDVKVIFNRCPPLTSEDIHCFVVRAQSFGRPDGSFDFRFVPNPRDISPIYYTLSQINRNGELVLQEFPSKNQQTLPPAWNDGHWMPLNMYQEILGERISELAVLALKGNR